MGCGSSTLKEAKPNTATKGDPALRSIILWGAQRLPSMDAIGKADPYCVARVGPKGSSWDTKLRGSGRRSQPASGSNPDWKMAFTIDVAKWPDPELQVRVYDAVWVGADEFLGEAVAPLSSLGEDPSNLALISKPSEPGKDGQPIGAEISVSAGSVDLLEKLGCKLSSYYEKLAPVGKAKSVKVEDITGKGPLRVGTAPLPESMQGLFWLSSQGPSSALASFAGPTQDGGGCSTGQMRDKRYDIRVAGDRVWAFAEDNTIAWKFVETVDLIYHFVFDDAEKPTKCQIYPEAGNLGFTLDAEWLLDFEAHLKPEGSEEYPGSVIWLRPSFVLGKEVNEYTLVQVMNGAGERIEPAWSKFVEYQNSDAAGAKPGVVFYHEIGSPA
ncbi:unnamed protein product [Prorocentrum cordatum]|uniref:C2 domain-containing protein n=1 Tax=Prorocentrum cordatum TaxID=2364126 RepID=A0ABN9U2S1_9DINO|nr:unnamed protein product [Polarella glacialis]|mmetsp:Transcript_88362/g.230274  ORF Transcript_88362/g.230274 Transcript_88362/m.230274 type:complete len:383 (-) Transcript_88362:111-1259(-)